MPAGAHPHPAPALQHSLILSGLTLSGSDVLSGLVESLVVGALEGFKGCLILGASGSDILCGLVNSRPREGGSPRRRFALKGGSVQKGSSMDLHVYVYIYILEI